MKRKSDLSSSAVLHLILLSCLMTNKCVALQTNQETGYNVLNVFEM